MCTNPDDSESQLCPLLVHVNCQDYWKNSANLNSIIYPINFEALWEAFSIFFFSFLFTLCSSIETLGVLQVHIEL